jgi:asparagine synthase (glutamine-hydrolysing)
MCGIAGFAGDFDTRVLTAMSDALVHRGPDDAGAEVFLTGADRIGLAARRLAILDLSAAGHQPMTVQCPACGLTGAPAASVWLIFNGEIYNFPELRRDLALAGHVFASHSDTEVILHLYMLLGPDMFQRLNGMFALAIYDGRPHGQRGGIRQGDVVIARDGIGI